MGTAVATTQRSLKTLMSGEDFKRAVAQALPRHLSAERFIRVAITALTRTPKLQRCTQESFFKCLLDLSAMGLEPDGRHAHLIPFENTRLCQCGHWFNKHNATKCLECACTAPTVSVECTLIVDYKGMVQLVRRSGEVSYIHADVVYKGDEFDYCYGTGAFLKHKPALDGERKNRLATYCFVRMTDGSEDFLVWGPSRVDAAKNRSKAKDAGPWAGTQEDYDEMAKKSVFRNQSKWLPFSPEVRSLIERADDAIDIPSSEFSLYDPGVEENVRRAKLIEMISSGNIINARKMAEDWEIDFAPYEDGVQQNPHATERNEVREGATTTARNERAAQTEQPTAAPSGEASATPSPEMRQKELRAWRNQLGAESFMQVLGAAGFEDIEGVTSAAFPDLQKALAQKGQDENPNNKPKGFNFKGGSR